MDVGAAWRQATSKVGNSIIAGLLIVVVHVVAGLGLILCFVGALFTCVYAHGLTAGIVDWYGRVQHREAPVGAEPGFLTQDESASGSRVVLFTSRLDSHSTVARRGKRPMDFPPARRRMARDGSVRKTALGTRYH